MNLVDELHAICAALVQSGVRHAVCGGVALTMHGAPRTTKDIDVLIASEDLPRALDVVRPLGYAFPAFPMVFDEGTDRERKVQRVSKLEGGEHLVLDFLLAEASLRGFLEGSIHVDLPRGPVVVVAPPGEAALDPGKVEARLAVLSRIAVLERESEARARLAEEQRMPEEPFVVAAERRLRELHALCDLASYLRGAGLAHPRRDERS